MTTRFFKRLLGLLWIGTFILTGCQNNVGTTAPTVDTSRLSTQAAETIQAGNQRTEFARPATSTVTTMANTPAAPAATATPVVETATTVPLPENTATPPPVQATHTLAPVATSSAAQGDDRAQFVSMAPGNGVQVKTGSTWDMLVKVKNAGDKTWTIGYNLGYVRGDQMDSPDDFYLQNEVKPGETYAFVFTLKAPPTAGTKQVTWALRDAAGKDLLSIDFEVLVVQ